MEKGGKCERTLEKENKCVLVGETQMSLKYHAAKKQSPHFL